MDIINNELKSVDNDDVINGTIFIPNSVKQIGPFCFSNVNIHSINIPDSVIEICDSAFSDCESIESIILPANLKNIRNSCFKDCVSLKNITMGNKVEKIMSLAFSGCTNLKEINFSTNLKEIGFSSFYKCESLKKIILPDNLEIIDQMAFEECYNLQDVILPKSLYKINNFAFLYCNSLKKLFINKNCHIIGDGAFDLCDKLHIYFESSLFNYFKLEKISQITIGTSLIDEYNSDNLKKIQYTELIDVIYNRLLDVHHTFNLDKESFISYAYKNSNFKSVIDNIINKINLKEEINIESEIDRICILYPQTRFINFPNIEIFELLDNDMVKNYNHRIFSKLINHNILKKLNDKNIIINLIKVFGLFENDKYVYKRLEELDKILNHKIMLEEKDYNNLDKKLKNYFKVCNKQVFNLKENIKIPEEYNMFLKNKMNKYDVKLINNLDKRIGKLVKKFFSDNYLPNVVYNYELKDDILDEEKNSIYSNLLNLKIDNNINSYTLNRMFLDSPKSFNSKALNFIINNFDLILNDSNYQRYIKNILDRFDEINEFYIKMGNYNYNIIDMINYLNSYNIFNNEVLNNEFNIMVKNAGVTNQKYALEYQNLYNEMKIKRKSSIPRINEIYEFNNNYKVEIEILRLDNPLGLLVGESRFTNSCQRIGDIGEECLRHAVSDGRTICIYLYEKNQKLLLATSWVWRNGNLLCFDNIEGTKILKKNKILQDIVIDCYKIASNKIQDEAKKYNDAIDVITIGKGHSDIDLERFDCLGKQTNLYLYPKNYGGYSDASVGYFIKGKFSDINNSLIEPQVYMDERLVIHESGYKIKSSTFSKIKEIKQNVFDDNYDLYKNYDENLSVFVGDDWYLSYGNNVIIDFGMMMPSFDEEYLIRDKEIEKIVLELKDRGICLGINDTYLERIYNKKNKTLVK